MAINLNLNVKALTDEFRHLNPKDPGTWPVLPKMAAMLGILILIPVLGYFLDTKEQIEQLEAGEAQETRLKEEYLNKKRQAVNLDLHKQQLREIDQSFGALLRQLPNRAQMDALLVDINQAGLGRGLAFELFKPAARETVRDFYAELPIEVRITGAFHDIGAFASDIGQLSRIVTLNDVSIEALKDGALLMNTQARTFRYLDDEELAANRRAVQAAKKGAKK